MLGIDSLDQARATELINRLDGVNRVIACVDAAAPLAAMRVRASSLTPERLARLRRADAIVRRLSHESGFDRRIWQFPVILIPLGTDAAPDSVVLRPVDSVDGMTAQSVAMPDSLLRAHFQRAAGDSGNRRRILRPDAQTACHHRVGIASLPDIINT